MRYIVVYITLISAMIASIVLIILTFESKVFWKLTKLPTAILSGQAIIESAKFSWDRSVSSVDSTGARIFPSSKQYGGVSYNLVMTPRDTSLFVGSVDRFTHEFDMPWDEYPKLPDKRTTILVRSQNTESFLESYISEYNNVVGDDKLVFTLGFDWVWQTEISQVQTLDETQIISLSPVLLNTSRAGVMASSFDGRNPLAYMNGYPVDFKRTLNAPVVNGNIMLQVADSYWSKLYVFDRCLSDEEHAAVNSYLTSIYVQPNPIAYVVNDIPTVRIDAIVNQPVPTYKCVYAGPATFSFSGSLLGLALDTNTGVINGIPKAVGVSHVQIKCTTEDGANSITSLIIDVKPLRSFPNKTTYITVTSTVLGVSVLALIVLMTRYARSNTLQLSEIV